MFKMKLFLASNGGFLIERGYAFLGIPKSEMRIGYVTTASKGVENLQYLEIHKQAMRACGYAFKELDIEGKTKEELRGFFKDKNVIHVEGGNTFYLLKAFRETGFDVIVKELVAQGVPYVGSSAGAYLVCPTIEVSTWGPKVRDTYGVTDFTALNLVPFLVKAHYKDELKTRFQEKIKSCRYSVRFLRDGQGIFVEDGVTTFVGEGEEVKI